MKKDVVTFPSPSKDTLDSQLRFAIANYRLIQFTYGGAVRVAEPHDYGLRDGIRKVLVFQREKSGRKDGDVRGWRFLDTSKLQECIVLERTFSGSREAPDQQHHHWDVLYARVNHTP